jgi:hypothetical protein
MTLETYIRAQLVKFAMEEGQRHGGVNNVLAILHVLRNRVFAGWGDWQEVLDTAASKRGTIYEKTALNMRGNDARIVLNRIDEIYTRTDTSDFTGGALFYFDQGYPIEDWFKVGILERPEDHKRVAHIGPVWFYT